MWYFVHPYNPLPLFFLCLAISLSIQLAYDSLTAVVKVLASDTCWPSYDASALNANYSPNFSIKMNRDGSDLRSISMECYINLA